MTGAPLVLCLLAACSVADGGALEAGRDFDRLFDPDRQPRVPEKPVWSPDGTVLVYLWDDGEGVGLWLLDTARGGSPRILLRIGEGESIKRLRFLPNGKRLLLHRDSGLALVEVGSGSLRPLQASSADDEDPKLSPGGDRVALVRGGNLHVLDLETDRIRALTSDGDDDGILNGKTDWVYWEELWGRDSTGHWWSPDGSHLAYYRFDDRHVKRYPLVDFTETYPEVTWQRYPVAGEENPIVKIGVTAAGGGATVSLDTGDPAEYYLARVHWRADGKLAIERLNRDQTRLELLLCDPANGNCRSLLMEEHSTWVTVGGFTRFLDDGSFLWGSDRSGWTHLYHYSAEGELIRQVTPVGRSVTALEAVNEEAGWVVYTAFPIRGLSPSNRRVERVSLSGGTARILGPGEGWNDAVVAEETGNWVAGHADAETPRRLWVRDADGVELAELPSADELAAEREGLPSWRFLTIPGPEGIDLPARLLEPANRVAGERYPVIVYHYGCPESQVVSNNWHRRNVDLWHKWMAERGYGVFMVDNLQSLYFGREGEDRGHRQLGRVNFEAQLSAVEYLKSLDWVDGERLGLWGWSGGGANTLYCLVHSPGTWKAGVAGAPVTDWRLYDTIWTERYMDHPDQNREGYAESSPITNAHKLEDRLLIVHGTADDNVHPHNTLAFIKRLIEAGIPFEDAIYPRQKHGFEKPVYNHFLRRMTEFFDRHLR